MMSSIYQALNNFFRTYISRDHHGNILLDLESALVYVEC